MWQTSLDKNGDEHFWVAGGAWAWAVAEPQEVVAGGVGEDRGPQVERQAYAFDEAGNAFYRIRAERE